MKSIQHTSTLRFTLPMTAAVVLVAGSIAGCNSGLRTGLTNDDASTGPGRDGNPTGGVAGTDGMAPEAGGTVPATPSNATNADAPVYADVAIISTSVDAGTTQASPTNGVDASTIGPLGPTQSWTGYVENYTFPSGSDVIKLSFAYDSNGQAVGQVLLGNGTPPPPATDPNVGYPPGFTGPFLPNEIEGFAYSMVGGTFAASRLRFTIEGSEPWAGWCALQTPPSDGSSGCLPNFSSAEMGGTQCSYTTSSDGPTIVVDCGKWYLCYGPLAIPGGFMCLCSSAGCGAQPGLLSTSFDMFLANGAASGSMVGSAVSGGETPYNIHFVQDP